MGVVVSNSGKNIVVCSDGTGNSAIKGRGTNVFKLFEAIDLNGHRTDPTLVPQVALYDDGVGTENFKPIRVFAGATGYGLSRNVKQLYKELVRIHDPVDRIFLVGFSRGAFTVRTLAGLIATCGILNVSRFPTRAALDAAVDRAYGVYRQRYRTALVRLVRGDPDPAAIERFKRECCHEGPVTIRFIGVWDTVDAVGLPFHLGDLLNLVIYRFKFPDHYLSPSVERACHALAIDDERHSFHPLLWKLKDEPDQQRIEQVWFAGAHSNVGGGYPKQGVSLVALDWMLHKAEKAGLRVLATDRRFYLEHANVDDKVYDPRAGVGVFYRWKPRDIAKMCAVNNVKPTLHLSVLERIAHGTEDYTPGNLAPDARVVITPTGDSDADAIAQTRAGAVETVLHAAHSRIGKSLLSLLPRWIAVGRLSYYVYLATCVAVVLVASAPQGAGAWWHPWAWLTSAASLLYAVATFQGAELVGTFKRLSTSPALLGVLAAGFLVSYVLSLLSDRRMSAVFSQFWHEQQPKLRTALKAARAAARSRITGSSPWPTRSGPIQNRQAVAWVPSRAGWGEWQCPGTNRLDHRDDTD